MMPVLLKVQEDHDLMLSDWDIENLIQESEKAGRIARLVKGKAITAEKAKMYKAIIAGKHWTELESTYKSFKKDIMKEMNTPVDMMVFEYNNASETSEHMPHLDSIKRLHS